MSFLESGLRSVGLFINKNSTNILMIIGSGGVFGTAAAAVAKTPEAMAKIDAKKIEKEQAYLDANPQGPLNFDEKDAIGRLTTLEIIKATWKCYVPAATIGIGTVICIVGLNSIHLRRNAALISLYTITRDAYDKYREKVLEEIGKNKEEKVRERIAQDHLDRNPVGTKRTDFTGVGDTLFFDPLSARYFLSDPEFIRRCVNEFNRRVISDSYRSLNAFYDDLNLEHVRDGDNIGWLVDHLMEIRFITKLTPDEKPCIVLDFFPDPEKLKWP